MAVIKKDPWDNRRTRRESFFKRFRKEAQDIKPKFVKIAATTTLFAARNSTLAIREAARRKVLIRFTYRRLSDERVKSYLCEPYSFRFRRTQDGVRKVMYAYHFFHKSIHMFILNRVLNVFVTDRKFRPRWRIEIR